MPKRTYRCPTLTVYGQRVPRPSASNPAASGPAGRPHTLAERLARLDQGDAEIDQQLQELQASLDRLLAGRADQDL